MPLLLLPLAGVFFFLMASSKVSGQFMLIEARGILDSANSLLWMGWGLVTIGCAVLAYMDAARCGFGTKPDATGGFKWGPGQWAAGMILLWSVSFPWYFAARRQVQGAPNRFRSALGITILVTIFGLGSAAAIGKVESEVQAKVAEMQRELNKAQREFQQGMQNMDREMREFQRAMQQ